MRLLLLSLLTGCAAPGLRYPGPLDSLGEALPAPTFAAPSEAPAGLPVASAAEHYLGKSKLAYDGQTYRYDCSGLVEAAYARAELPVTGSSVSLYERARELGVFHRQKTPELGDVAFFEETYDRNGNGRIDDGITHVAVVVALDRDGTITMVHKGTGGVVRLYMNLARPDTFQDESGKVLNSYLRNRSSRDPRSARYLSGQLWRGFASFWLTGR